MARVGTMCYLNWKANSRNPYEIAYLTDLPKLITEISYVESGYKFAWSFGNILAFTVSRQKEYFYISCTEAGACLDHKWRQIAWDLEEMKSAYREILCS